MNRDGGGWAVSSIVDRWNAAYFDTRLSPGVLAALESLVEADADAQALADRVFRLMRAARIDPADLSVFTAWLIGFSAPRTVPSAWNGQVPPVTMPSRHHKLDEYVAGNGWHRPHAEPVLVDLGCGFPPFTAVDSAARLRGWRVIGVDPSFGRYLVYDEEGDYACFDDETHLRYFRTGTVDPDPAATRTRFSRVLHRLLPQLPDEDSGELHEVHDGGARLFRNPLRGYEQSNLALVQGEVGSVEIADGVDVLRCMNVSMYFDRAFRQRLLQWAAKLIRPGGLLLCGSNWARSVSSRYTVYQQHGGRLVAREFAFSVENVRPLELAPWYALHDDDLDNLSNAAAVATLRGDERFRRQFDERLDALLAQRGFCTRGSDGYLGGPDQNMSVDEQAEQVPELADQLDREGFVEDAVGVLRRAGRQAWRNAAGHVAMRPMEPPRLPPSQVL